MRLGRLWCEMFHSQNNIKAREKKKLRKGSWCRSFVCEFRDYLRLNFSHLFRLQFFIVALGKKSQRDHNLNGMCRCRKRMEKTRKLSVEIHDVILFFTSRSGIFFALFFAALLLHLDFRALKSKFWWKVPFNLIYFLLQQLPSWWWWRWTRDLLIQEVVIYWITRLLYPA